MTHPESSVSRRQFHLCALGGLSAALVGDAEAAPPGPWATPARVRKAYIAVPKPTWPRPTIDVEDTRAEIEARLAEVERRHPNLVRFTGGELVRTMEDAARWVEAARWAGHRCESGRHHYIGLRRHGAGDRRRPVFRRSCSCALTRATPGRHSRDSRRPATRPRCSPRAVTTTSTSTCASSTRFTRCARAASSWLCRDRSRRANPSSSPGSSASSSAT